MAFDATTPNPVDDPIIELMAKAAPTCEERRAMLRHFLAHLDDSMFDMRVWNLSHARPVTSIAQLSMLKGRSAPRPEVNCKTCCCIGGWTESLFDSQRAFDPLEHSHERTYRVGALLGLSFSEAHQLFYPAINDVQWAKLTNLDAVRVLEQYETTGRIDWSKPQ